MKNLLLIALFLTYNTPAFAASDNYKVIKEKIDSLENAIIQDFSIDYPKDRKSLSTRNYVKLASQVEVKYGIQKALFFKIENEFFKIDKSLASKVNLGELTKEEADQLKNSIEYASRIILKSRKAEINEIYSEFKSHLTHSPKLDSIYNQLSSLNAHNCSLSNLKLDKQQKILSFDIKKKNKFGSWTSSQYQISEQDIQQGNLTSKLENKSDVNLVPNLVTQFQIRTDENYGIHQFTLLQDDSGNILEASFKQENSEPLINFLGLSFGTQKINKHINCISKTQNTVKGPTPASK